ncbi:MAG: hypothetical protein PHQ52_05280, partial [Candidatus Omnitrophica bacterium]|nr:hypothetical protein [Candidatus Omnitrophota bacterium]
MDNTERTSGKINISVVSQGQDLAEICRTFAHSTEFHFSGVIDLAINQVNKQACDSLNILHAINLSELAKYGHIDMILCLADN